jgi:enediyne biosynthesis protein E4
VFSTLGDRPVLLRNRADTGHNWLILVLEGTRSNRDGLGAWVEVTADGQTSKQEARCPTGYVFQEDTRLHFGLGSRTQADRIQIRWPSGVIQVLSQIPANQILAVREPGESRWTAAP